MYKANPESVKSQITFPDKLFYKIGDVSRIVGVEPYVLRYWETEFSFLKPRKNKSGQRVYVKKDVELLLSIKKLLYQERYTIEGVRKRLGLPPMYAEPGTEQEVPKKEARQSARGIEHIKKRLREILGLLR